MKAIITALGLPTNFKVTQHAKGNLPSGEYVEIASLHSGIGGVNGALAKYTHTTKGWAEINGEEYRTIARQIFRL
jgi:hypothetical protein